MISFILLFFFFCQAFWVIFNLLLRPHRDFETNLSVHVRFFRSSSFDAIEPRNDEHFARPDAFFPVFRKMCNATAPAVKKVFGGAYQKIAAAAQASAAVLKRAARGLVKRPVGVGSGGGG